ncbi:signal peptide peptidase SppA [Spirulina sp. 06S082]|uniref:signal peptide peptidase SppA n=1 Tax=Spirulina sp. 06S082 TaxID=3110248 RepID=UPI002B206197|nr:signal peptide peptidase SppA [Spirulina sp. 06S082]MEA5471347.1 signal peptide peptidase SppA [Spirulina sp. 06S082]
MQFLKQVFASLLGTFLAFVLFSIFGVSIFTVMLLAALVEEEAPHLKDKSILTFDLSAEIQDTVPIASFAASFTEGDDKILSLRHAVKAIEAAAKDDRIVALFLDGSGGEGSSGYANLQALRRALEKFQEADKKIIAYDVDWTERKYYLGSIADEILLNPMGAMELNGLGSQQLFFTGALEKFGIGVQIVRVGKYKSAVEPYTQQQLSPENREQLENLLGDLWENFLQVVGKSREISSQQLQNLVSTRGLFLPQEAISTGLADELAYLDEVEAKFRKLTQQSKKKQGFRQIDLGTYAEIARQESRSSANKVGILYAQGTIVYGEGSREQMGSDRLMRQLRELRDDDEIKTVVLRIDSPGGSALASELILRELQLLQKKKPTIVSMGNVAASGGYWIAMGADRIFAELTTVTGSIGVFSILPNIEKIAAENGLTWDVVKTAPFADTSSISRPKTEQELKIIQGGVDRIYELFLDKVAKSRYLPRETVAAIAQGRVWSGLDAKKLGLVDELGGLDAAIAYAAKKADLGEDWQVEEYREEPSFNELLGSLFSLAIAPQQTQFSPSSSLMKEWQNLQKELNILQNLNDPQNIYTLFPFSLNID